MKYILNYDIDDLSAEALKKQFMDNPISNKVEILKYMKSLSPSIFTSAPVIDVFTDEEVKSADNGYTDGEYTWYESEIYYFEKYNLKLNDDFIEYVLSKV
jgi:hypothetical protein